MSSWGRSVGISAGFFTELLQGFLWSCRRVFLQGFCDFSKGFFAGVFVLSFKAFFFYPNDLNRLISSGDKGYSIIFV